MTRIIGSLMAIALALCLALSGCGAPDRKPDADKLEQAIKGMPGVHDAMVSYTNDFERGATVHINVFVPDASAKQIEDVVARINEVRGDSFTKFDQTAEFAVTPTRTIVVKRGADLDPPGVASDAEGLRKVTAAVGAGEATLFRNKSTADLDLRKVAGPADDVFAAVRAGFGDTARLDVDLLSLGSDRPSWRAAFPFSIADQQRVNQQLAAMPVEVFRVAVGSDGTISALGVRVHNQDSAYQDLVSVIGITGAGPAHPLNINWRLDGATQTPQFSGSVDVGACRYVRNSEGELHPEKYLTPDALALQQRMRKQFDTCPK
ncbi:hypothetical protein PT015_12805 [Candidatus Mycobacterium wuenschmannii]|uniref:Lipoprotein n=1 Tax=Candidatus Mycobacterium wuenschmannii TaxID=3027808 RepID=A0ABY8VSR9_9MYCO|nr:hypothetical protein [Candidatus Mycobacterium wuenschmannii]WIM85829.1 hypothetical protein PT015_12805 [Candidatus Mycobacterium wuenschmannii]